MRLGHSPAIAAVRHPSPWRAVTRKCVTGSLGAVRPGVREFGVAGPGRAARGGPAAPSPPNDESPPGPPSWPEPTPTAMQAASPVGSARSTRTEAVGRLTRPHERLADGPSGPSTTRHSLRDTENRPASAGSAVGCRPTRSRTHRQCLPLANPHSERETTQHRRSLRRSGRCPRRSRSRRAEECFGQQSPVAECAFPVVTSGTRHPQ